MMCILDAMIIKQNIGGYLVFFLILPKKNLINFWLFSSVRDYMHFKIKIEIRKQPTGNLLCP